MIPVRYIVTAPFRVFWFLTILPFLVFLWMLALLKQSALAVVRYNVHVCILGCNSCVDLYPTHILLYVARSTYIIGLDYYKSCIHMCM